MPVKLTLTVKLVALTILFFSLATPLYSQLTGATMSDPFDKGVFQTGSGQYFGEAYSNSIGYGDDYGGINEDVFYKFTVNGDTEIYMQLNAATMPGTIWLLNENGEYIDYREGNLNSSDLTTVLSASVPAGTYYIVVECAYWYSWNLYYSLDVWLDVS